MKVLAGDIGGTSARLMLAQVGDAAPRPVLEAEYRSGAYAGLAPILREFLADAGDTGRDTTIACLAIAGPVRHREDGQHARVTNLPWALDSTSLAHELGIGRVRLVNDFEAAGYGLEALAPQDLVTLQAGEAVPRAPRALIGAGTGLGQATLIWHEDGYRVYPSEGGHTDLAPADAEQRALLESLQERFGHVSWERVVSGPGLPRILEFLAAHRGLVPGEALEAAMDERDPSAAITELALAQRDALAMASLDLFVRLYGSQAGNLALTVLAQGGVFVAGGIAPKILEWLRHGSFLEAFHAKGRMRPLVEAMPVHVVTNARVGLLGAAVAATRL